MYLLIIVLPFLSFFFSLILGRWLSQFIRWVSNTCIFFSLLLSVHIFYRVIYCKEPVIVYSFSWIDSLNVSWTFQFDGVSSVMLVVVTSISFLVHFYSISYMGSDPHFNRFISFLSLFTFFMLVLVTSSNFLQLFLGWEGVGLASYLLINFWYTRTEANRAALKALIVNRFGDFGVYFALLLIFYHFKSLDFSVVFSLVSFVIPPINLVLFNYTFNVVDLICFFLLLGVVGKSAQFGLHTWLPDAMEGPTPVSALLHAATMVTAGVFVLIRCSFIFSCSSFVLLLVVLMGSITTFFAAVIGCFQNDIKKIVAYSTCSQLGYMVLACGLCEYSLALFHLFNHAFFKALLFLGAGSIIHAMADEQDLRRLGGLAQLMPFTYISFLIGSFSLAGFPFLSGFFSKDLILESASSSIFLTGSLGFFWSTLAVFLTSFYSMRLLSIVFLNKPLGFFKYYHYAAESDFFILVPLFILSLLSIFSGYIFFDLFVGLGSDGLSSIYNSWDRTNVFSVEFLLGGIKFLPLLFSILGFLVSYFFYVVAQNLVTKFFVYSMSFFHPLYVFFNQKWLFDIFYNLRCIVSFVNVCYNFFFKTIDRGFVELLGPLGLSRVFYKLSRSLSIFQTGFLYHYVFFTIFSIIALIVFHSLFFIPFHYVLLVLIFLFCSLF